MVWDLSLPLYERKPASGTRVYHLQNRICGGIPAHAGQTRPVPSRVSCHWNAHQGVYDARLSSNNGLDILDYRHHQTKSFANWNYLDPSLNDTRRSRLSWQKQKRRRRKKRRQRLHLVTRRRQKKESSSQSRQD